MPIDTTGPHSARNRLSHPLRWLPLLLAAAMTALILYLGSQPFAVNLFPAPWDKLAHFLAYAAIALLLWLATNGQWPLIIIFATAAIGGIDEWRQASLPGRSADVGDLLIDLLAAGVTVLALWLYQRRITPLQFVNH